MLDIQLLRSNRALVAERLAHALDLAVRGQNLLHGRHREFAAPDGEEIGRSVFAELRWRR